MFQFCFGYWCGVDVFDCGVYCVYDFRYGEFVVVDQVDCLQYGVGIVEGVVQKVDVVEYVGGIVFFIDQGLGQVVVIILDQQLIDQDYGVIFWCVVFWYVIVNGEGWLVGQIVFDIVEFFFFLVWFGSVDFWQWIICFDVGEILFDLVECFVFVDIVGYDDDSIVWCIELVEECLGIFQ